jgi:drug/metabolite transporter (DMT)-like permease
LTGILSGIVAALIWAGFPVITKLGMAQTLSAMDVTALRFGVAGLVMLPFFLRRGLAGLDWRVACLLACGAGAPYLLFAAGGLAFAPAAHMGVITPSCMLLCSTVGSRIWLGDRLDAGRLVGIAAIVAGLVTLGWDGLANQGSNAWIGDLMFAAGGLFWASFTIASRYWSVSPRQATEIVSVFSLFGFLPIYFVLSGGAVFEAPVRELLVQGVFQGLLSAILALLLYSRAVAVLGAARGALFGALVPSFALALAVPILNELPTGLQLLGVLLVTAGMIWALKRRAAQPAAGTVQALRR